MTCNLALEFRGYERSEKFLRWIFKVVGGKKHFEGASERVSLPWGPPNLQGRVALRR